MENQIYINNFCFMTFNELYNTFSWKVFLGERERKIVKVNLFKPFVNFKFPIVVESEKIVEYERYVASQSGITDDSYYETQYAKMPEKRYFQTDELWKIYEKLTDQRFWKNYNFIKEFIKFHKMCWNEYHKNMPK